MTTQLLCTQCNQTQFEEELIQGYLCSYCFSDSLVEREIDEALLDVAQAKMMAWALDRVFAT